MNCRTSVCGQLGHFYCPACDQKIVCGGFGGRVVPKRTWLCHGNGDTFMDRRNGGAEGTQRPVVLRITKMGKNQNTRNPEIMCWIVDLVTELQLKFTLRSSLFFPQENVTFHFYNLLKLPNKVFIFTERKYLLKWLLFPLWKFSMTSFCLPGKNTFDNKYVYISQEENAQQF